MDDCWSIPLKDFKGSFWVSGSLEWTWEFWDPPWGAHDYCFIIRKPDSHRDQLITVNTLFYHTVVLQSHAGLIVFSVCSNSLNIWRMDGHLTELTLYLHLSLSSDFLKQFLFIIVFMTDHTNDFCEQVRHWLVMSFFNFCLWILEEKCNRSGLNRNDHDIQLSVFVVFDCFNVF